ncbi:hypothetical protein C8R44DRAFT_864540 [Mycena epipterygia]|nr:hypothetical protein C8R44DRAFT_864540 [Mycena epipterygia]
MLPVVSESVQSMSMIDRHFMTQRVPFDVAVVQQMSVACDVLLGVPFSLPNTPPHVPPTIMRSSDSTRGHCDIHEPACRPLPSCWARCRTFGVIDDTMSSVQHYIPIRLLVPSPTPGTACDLAVRTNRGSNVLMFLSHHAHQELEVDYDDT